MDPHDPVLNRFDHQIAWLRRHDVPEIALYVERNRNLEDVTFDVYFRVPSKPDSAYRKFLRLFEFSPYNARNPLTIHSY